MRIASFAASSLRTGMRLALLILMTTAVALMPGRAAAQSDDGDDANDAAADTAQVWVKDLSGKLSASQAAFSSNWQQGGVNSLAFTSAVDGTAERRGVHWLQTHELRLAFGMIQQSGDPARKSDDLIRLQSNLRYQGDHFFRVFKPTIAAGVITQFAKGFNFETDPFTGDDLPDDTDGVQTSAFFSPAFITESIGLTFEPDTWYSLRLSLASKQTVVNNKELRVLYDVNRDKLARVEGGGEFVASINRELAENIRYKASFNAFYSFNQTDVPPDFRFENFITMKVNSWLSTNLEFVALYDDNIDESIQLKEVLSIGVSLVFI